MSMSELCTKGAGELAAMIRAHQVTSREVVDAHLARIEEVNPSVNAVTVTLADEARDAAAAVDRAVAAGALLGPLARRKPLVEPAPSRAQGDLCQFRSATHPREGRVQSGLVINLLKRVAKD